LDESIHPEQEAPWGALGALMGVVIAFLLLVFLTLMVESAAQVLTFDANSLGVRTAKLLASQLALATVPITSVFVLGGPWLWIGWRASDRRELIRAASLGVTASAATMLYLIGLRWGFPAGFLQLVAEQNTQVEQLGGARLSLVLMALIVAPLCEELFFRSFFFAGLRQRMSFPLAAGLSTALFTLMHAMPWSSPPLFLVGLAAAWTYERKKCLLAAFTMHATFNLCELLISALKVLP